MEAEKLNNGDRKSGSCEAGFFIAGLVVHDGASIKPVIAVQGRRG